MDPAALRAAFRVAILIVIVAVAMLPFQPPNSAEFVVTVLAGIAGIIFIVLVAVLARLSGSRPPNPKTVDRAARARSNVRMGPRRDS